MTETVYLISTWVPADPHEDHEEGYEGQWIRGGHFYHDFQQKVVLREATNQLFNAGKDGRVRVTRYQLVEEKSWDIGDLLGEVK